MTQAATLPRWQALAPPTTPPRRPHKSRPPRAQAARLPTREQAKTNSRLLDPPRCRLAAWEFPNHSDDRNDDSDHRLRLHSTSGLLAQPAAGVTSYYLLGRLGSVLGLTNASGSLVDHYTYTPYGRQTVLAQAAPNLSGYDGDLMVTGSPLSHFGDRYADPALGLWTQLGLSGQNPAYVFAAENPVNYTDVNGLRGGVFSCIGSVLTTAATFGGVATIGGGAIGCTIAGGPFDLAACASVGAAGAALGGTGGFFFGLGYGMGQQIP